ncbi:MAG: hypothetical protein ABI980_04320 [Nitrospirota bacterium]
MKRLLIGLVTILAIAPVCWADEDKSDPPAKGEVRIQDLPKPVQELLQKIQQLSKKIEPEITRLGSRMGQELTQTVKKLCDELRCQEQPESK